MREQLDSNESKWLKQAKQGDTEAFSCLLELYLPKVYGLCLKMTGHKEDAEDCVQETFIKVWTNLGDFRENSSLYTWVYRIASNTCSDYLRKKNKYHVLPLEENLNNSTIPVHIVRDEEPLPDEQLNKKEEADEVRRLLYKLPDKLREVLILRDLQQLSYSEISLVQGVAEGTVKSRLYRARSNMMKLLKDSELFNS